ncbi:hypothetical protein [Lactiplantibacillus plantarum]|uniref:hypothetical protein n=1 Tax=Lactiplantibacillus plantarum TaxID=1590 RepID=UPI0007B55582|nr:hypothetical protein [Lactiplantibacillus plantarum]KZU17083.1 hypothetical protein Nizo2484_2494 [Lactiplantibacillus plantarum]KZU28839.1 hypothetical protein Nizo2485_0176 [Lactiplantibacillus plantarum]
MEKSKELLSMLENPEYFLNAQRQTLESRIEAKKLTKSETKKVRIESAKSVGRKASMDLLNQSCGDMIVDIIGAHEEIEGKLNESKEALLLGEYLNKSDNQEYALKRLINVITDPYGSILFNKLLLILKDYPADGDMMDILRDTLLNLSDVNNFKSVFTKYKFLISLIDRITPQAMVILQDYLKWPPFSMSMIINNNHVEGDMSKEFTDAYSHSKGIDDPNIVSRIQYSVQELQKNEFVFGSQISTGQVIMQPSEVGMDLIGFINHG